MMYFFFLKQKTAYERRSMDWSADVCSSDLGVPHHAAAADDRAHGPAGEGHALERGPGALALQPFRFHGPGRLRVDDREVRVEAGRDARLAIGRASCRERVCMSV